MVLERTVKLVTGLVQFVTKVCGLLPDVVILTSGLLVLLRVKMLLVPELALMFLMSTGRGKVIVPWEPPFVM